MAIKYSVDSKGNVYKNGSYVPAENYKYIPTSIIDQAKNAKNPTPAANPSAGAGGGSTVSDTAKALKEKYDAANGKTYTPSGTINMGGGTGAIGGAVVGSTGGTSTSTVGGGVGGSVYAGANAVGGPTGPAQPEPVNPQFEMQKLMEMFMQAMQGQTEAQKAQFEALAKQQAEAQANTDKSNISKLITDLNSNKQYELDAIQNNLEAGKSDVEENTFAKWLQSRQDVANRGLGGSGLSGDANTRLQLGANRDIQKLYREANSELAQTTRSYGSQLSSAYERLSQINPALMQTEIMQRLFNDSSQSMTEKAKILSDMIGQFLPYSTVKPIDMMQLSSDERQFYDKLNTENQQFYAGLESDERKFFSKLTSDEQQFYAKLQVDDRQFVEKLNQDLRLGLANVMGVDPVSGRPTIDAMKLQEQIRSNRASEGLSAARIRSSESLGYARINADIEKAAAELDMKAAQMEQTAWKNQADLLNDQIQNDLDAIDSLYKGLPNLSGAQKDAAIKQIETLSKRVDSGNATLDVFINGQSSQQAQKNFKDVVTTAKSIWDFISGAVKK